MPRASAKVRCSWCGSDPLYVAYHDAEWGVPVYGDARLFEFLILEGAQAGLSWLTILKRRETYRRAYSGFDAEVVAGFGARQIRKLLSDEGIIRNRLKVESSVKNARVFLEIQEEFGSFSDYQWQFVGGKPKINRFRRTSDIPAQTRESTAFSRDLKERGMSFVGPTIMYAYMQAVGMVNDHLVGCFRHKPLSRG